MKYILKSAIIVGFLMSTFGKANSLSLNIKSDSPKMKLVIATIGNERDAIAGLVKDIKEYLGGGWQTQMGFDITIDSFEEIKTKQQAMKLFQKGYASAIFIKYCDNGNAIEWRIYDCREGKMLKGKRISGIATKKQGLAELVADELWSELTGQEGICSTKIAYCQNMLPQKTIKNIYLTSPCRYVPELLLKGGRPLAPRWNKNLNKPLLYYSEITHSNIRLMSVAMNKKTEKILNNDGISMLPSCSTDGNKIIYCASHQGNSQLYCYEYDRNSQESIVRCLTNNSGNNVSPTLRENGDVIFCSDAYAGKSPQICYFFAQTKKIISLTKKNSSCTAPAFCEANNMIAYISIAGNSMQIFTHNVVTNKSQQLTFSEGNKDEPTWSPDGNYIAFSTEYKNYSRIAVMNILTKEWAYITPEDLYCNYPAWSPRYTYHINVE